MKKLSVLFILLLFVSSCAQTSKFYLKDYHALSNPVEANASIGLVLFNNNAIGNVLAAELIKKGFNVKPIDFIERLVSPGNYSMAGIKTSIKIDSKLEDFEDFIRSKKYNNGWFSYEHEAEIKKVFNNLKENYKLKYILFVSQRYSGIKIGNSAIKTTYEFKLIDIDTMNLVGYELIKLFTPRELKFKDLKKLVKYVVIPVLEGKAPKDPVIKVNKKKIKMTIIR